MRNLTAQELNELQELTRVASAEKWKAMQVKGNTALVPDGQKYSEQSEAVSRLLENIRNQWLSAKLAECGAVKDEEVSINLQTGEILPKVTEVKEPENVATDNPKTE